MDLQQFIKSWLSFKLLHASKMRETAKKMLRLDQSVYTENQFRYADNLEKSIRYLITAVPKKFSNYHVECFTENNEPITLEKILEDAGIICQSSKP